MAFQASSMSLGKSGSIFFFTSLYLQGMGHGEPVGPPERPPLPGPGCEGPADGSWVGQGNQTSPFWEVAGWSEKV